MVKPSLETVVSCPGKVLLAGGYLVLDRAHTGIVVGTSARFYTLITSPPVRPSQELAPCSTTIRLAIRSPQFLNAHWSFLVSPAPNAADLLIQPETSSSPNPFVELAVRESLRLSWALQATDNPFILSTPNGSLDHMPDHTTITILGDNDFYSQPRQADDGALKPFNRLNTSLKEVHKTGLGSSAAMVTSLCSAILIHFTPSLQPHSPSTQLLLHNLSQYVHSLAQGKVGSGFDVSAALYGTHVYRRFSPSCLDGLLGSAAGEQAHPTPDQLRRALDPEINSRWLDPSTAPVIQRFTIPKWTTLVLADVDAGSHTPSMVGQVLKWKNSERDSADLLWNELSVQNDQLKAAFEKLERLSNSDESDYLSQVLQLSSDPNFYLQNDPSPVSDSDDVGRLFIKVSSITKSIRRLMKKMGNQSDVPIEPDSQTLLLDETEKRLGVVGSGVPGAGGYDAIWVLVFTPPDEEQVKTAAGGGLKSVEEFLRGWTHSSVRVLSAASWVIGGGRCAESSGIRISDDVSLVDGLSCFS